MSRDAAAVSRFRPAAVSRFRSAAVSRFRPAAVSHFRPAAVARRRRAAVSGRPAAPAPLSSARGQASLMMLGVVGALLAGTLVLFAFGNALGAKGQHQRAADLAAVSAAQVMRDLYPRLFEPPFIEPGVPNPRHLERAAYLELARAAAVRGAQRNGVRVGPEDVRFPGNGFAPTRVTVHVRGVARVRVNGDRRRAVPVLASATAELSPGPGAGQPASASGAGYDGPLAYRQGKPTPHLFSAV